MSEAAELDEIRSIEDLKARYCRLLDTKAWPAFRSLFSDDFVSDTSEAAGSVICGADEFVAFVSRTLQTCVTVHRVQQPEIRVTSADTAEGTWAMEDVVRFRPGLTLHGYGHYHETYEKSGDGWRITSSKLTRLRSDIETPLFSIFMSARIQGMIGRAAARRQR